MRHPGWWLAFLLATAAPPLAAQELTLADALRRAGESAWGNRIADAQARAAAGQALAPYRGILPSVRLEAGYISTTDPLNAFGFLLRQRAVTPAAFDPARLNDPAAIHNLATGVVIEQPLFNADAWAGRKAAASARDAADASAEWTRAGTAVEVIRGYWGAVLATAQVRTLTLADSAARLHQRQAEAMVRQGLATTSDGMLARVKAGELRAALLEAESQARLARLALALRMGTPADTLFTLPDTMPLPWAATDSTGMRADVRAATRNRDAAEADARRATLLYLPRVNGFGRLDWNTLDSPFAGKRSWTVGVMLSWSPFSGASELSEIRATRARRDMARAAAEATEAQAALELRAAREHLDVALERLGIATEAVQQATEAHRIVARKYDGGLATVTELFDAATAETASRLGRSAAAFDALVARADLDRATGKELTP
ncbi:MAG: TolC family protein [Gemmatimonadales bacterium]